MSKQLFFLPRLDPFSSTLFEPGSSPSRGRRNNLMPFLSLPPDIGRLLIPPPPDGSPHYLLPELRRSLFFVCKLLSPLFCPLRQHQSCAFPRPPGDPCFLVPNNLPFPLLFEKQRNEIFPEISPGSFFFQIQGLAHAGVLPPRSRLFLCAFCFWGFFFVCHFSVPVETQLVSLKPFLFFPPPLRA